MEDNHNLTRFVDAQQRVYESVVQELRNGRKSGHWMWYIFPQIAGLGTSPTSELYAIKSIDEARAYDSHPVLGPRLRGCTELVMAVTGWTAIEIFGGTDSLKFRSCMTLFDGISDERVFRDALDKYFDGAADPITLDFLKAGGGR